MAVKTSALVIASCLLSGCSTVVPRYDIPVDSNNQPTVGSIVERVRCELGAIATEYGSDNLLVRERATVAVQLNLDVNDTGALTPSFEYLSGPFTFTATPTFSQSREQSFNEMLEFTMDEIASDFKDPTEIKKCKNGYTNLEGNLGIKESIELAGTTNNVDFTVKGTGTSGIFGGFVTFVVTKGLGVGPNWTLKHFIGPGKFASGSEVNTDKIVFAVAFPDKKQKDAPAKRAGDFIASININHLTVQLGAIRSALQ